MTLHKDAELAVPRIRYEIEMFRYCSDILRRRGRCLKNGSRNAFLECFLLHARILRDFFVGEPRRDDMSAQHFLDGHSVWAERAPALCTYLTQNKKRLDQYIAHLTYERLKLDKTWDTQTIHDEIEGCVTLFLSSVPEPIRELFTSEARRSRA